VLLFGAGPRAGFDDERYRQVMLHMIDTIGGLRARIAVVELPGRQTDLVPAERAADMLLEAAGRAPNARHQDVWTLVENRESRKRIEQHMIEERRRVRHKVR
jgi:hypothetical protein